MSYYTVVNKLIKEAQTEGYKSEQQLQLWLKLIRDAALAEMMPERDLQSLLDRTLRGVFARETKRVNVGIVEPKLRQELDRRIAASANLIKLNRLEAIDKTLKRFSGWMTSGAQVDLKTKNETKNEIKKSLKQLPYAERRVLIDQGHKLAANINNIIAESQGAIAVIWHSHWRQAGYNYREDHKERDDLIYVIRGNWAMTQGLIKLAGHKYYDEITGFAVEPFCRCYGTYLYSVRDLPLEMWTEKAKGKLNETK